MRKFEVYWNISHDKFGGERRYPMMVVSTEEANEKSQFVTAVRLTNFEKYQSPSHVKIPREAWNRQSEIADAIVLCETVGSTRKTNLYGPISYLGNPAYQKMVDDALMALMNLGAMKPQPMYTGTMGDQARETMPMSETEAERFVRTVPPSLNPPFINVRPTEPEYGYDKKPGMTMASGTMEGNL